MRAILLVCFLSLLVNQCLSQFGPTSDTAGVAFSTETLNQLANLVIVPVVNDLLGAVGQKLPTNCCYANIEVKGSRLYLEDLTIPEESIQTTADVQTSQRGVFVEMDTVFNLTFYLHLCEETFGHCDTLVRCKGFSNIQFATTARAVIDVSADPVGEPIITVNDFFLHIAAPHKVGLCDLLSIFIDTLLPLLNDGINTIAPDLINAALAKYTSNLPQTIPFPKRPFDFHWMVSNNTASSTAGASLMLALDVLISNMDDKPGPFFPNYTLPNALDILEGESGVGLEFSDAILNNILFAYFSVKSPTLNTEVDGFKVEGELESPPMVEFTNLTGLDSAALVLKLKIVLKRDLLRIVSHSTVTTHFEVIVSSKGVITLQLDPENFVVQIDSTVPPVTNGTKTLIEKDIEDAWASAIPSVNDGLQDHGIQLPPIADFNNPDITYGNGYAALGFDTAQPPERSALLRKFFPIEIVEAFTNPIGSQLVDSSSSCPDLSAVGASFIECETPKE
jgi:hypothetical protein